ncbi:hypothetical protein RFI_13741 [Reticulomyxa filosa]|uniref:Uncharacterized protein n=1 Tax=Reticulomyxa filosa TaxID=46433 RepID=X6NAY7_RETFI|nr:hypothetical protein RFI_13741 [Reticulomyxa filosa]|eukprot:ETO23440.1 hypothetical protein RFI_13741 [Reticulomyxa filosa]
MIWISYDGGMQPFAPRGVTPIKWENPGSETAFLGIPFNSKTNQERKFYLRDVKEVREKTWLRQEDGKPNRFGNKRKNPGKSREERQNNGTKPDADTTATNAATYNNRSKQKQRQPRDNKKSTPTSNAPGKSIQQTK